MRIYNPINNKFINYKSNNFLDIFNDLDYSHKTVNIILPQINLEIDNIIAIKSNNTGFLLSFDFNKKTKKLTIIDFTGRDSLHIVYYSLMKIRKNKLEKIENFK